MLGRKYSFTIRLAAVVVVFTLLLSACNLFELLDGDRGSQSYRDNPTANGEGKAGDPQVMREIMEDFVEAIDESDPEMPARPELGSVGDVGKVLTEDYKVMVFPGDARYFSTPPKIFFANTAEFPSPPGGEITYGAQYPAPYFNWLSVREAGEWIAFTSTENVIAIGVELWGDYQDGIVEIQLDGQPIWQGDTFFDNCPQLDTNGYRIVSPETCSGAWAYYIEASGLWPGKHTMRAVNAGGGETTVFFFGTGKISP